MTARVYFDGHCALCRAAAPRLRRLARPGAIELRDFRVDAELAPELRSRCESEVLLVLPDGRAFGGADAIVQALGTRRVAWLFLWLYLLPPVRWLARAGYRWVAARRLRLALARGACDGACGVHVHRPANGTVTTTIRIKMASTARRS